MIDTTNGALLARLTLLSLASNLPSQVGGPTRYNTVLLR